LSRFKQRAQVAPPIFGVDDGVQFAFDAGVACARQLKNFSDALNGNLFSGCIATPDFCVNAGIGRIRTDAEYL